MIDLKKYEDCTNYDAISYRGEVIVLDTNNTYYPYMRSTVGHLMDFGSYPDDIRRAIEVIGSGKKLADVNFTAHAMDRDDFMSWGWRKIYEDSA